MKTTRQMYLEGLRKQQLARTKEPNKKGNLRGGDTAFYIDGLVFNGCMRLAMLRQLGIHKDLTSAGNVIEPYKNLMFDGGEANEEMWANVWETELDGLEIATQDEVGITWQTSNGTVVSGRPDIVLRDKTSKKIEMQYEMKQVVSPWTFRDCILEGKPKLENIGQAVHYGVQLGGGDMVPTRILYTSRAEYYSKWRGMPNRGEEGSEFFNYKEGDDKPLKTKYQFRGYDLWLDKDGYIWYCDEEKKLEPMRTIGSWQAIERFYEETSKLLPAGRLGPRPEKQIDIFGAEKNYTICNYCELAPICDRQTSFKSWLKEVETVHYKVED